MIYRILADSVVVIHFAFILFVIFGALLVLKWNRLMWFHIPCAIWGALIEFAGWICPLTPLENQLRIRSGAEGYHSSFIEHYIIPIIYPTALNRSMQIFLGILVLVINLGIYGLIFYKRHLKSK